MPKKRPTQADVARAAGVSRATVSYVLNNLTNQRIPISPETRQRVQDVILQLGYQVDARAQALRSGDTRIIGVLLPIYENPFFWQILQGISAETESCGYSVLLSHNALTPEQEDQSMRDLAEQRVDGLILLVGFLMIPEQVREQLRRSSHRIVQITSADSEYDYVKQGYGEGTLALMSYLIEQGHRRIGFVYGVAIPVQGIDRLEAYYQALSAAGIEPDESLVMHCGPLMEDGYHATRALLSRPDRPTAIITINDLLGMAAVRAAADLSLRIPQDVSIASFDDIPFTRYMVPRLTSVAGRPEQNGRDAVRLLIKRLNDPDRPHEVIHSEWALHIRESTGPAPKRRRS